MFKYLFHKRLRECRKNATLTQKQAGDTVGISRQRWSQLETGYRSPSKNELCKVRQLFHLGEVFIPPPNVYRELRDRGASLLPDTPIFLVSQDRDSFFRCWKASKLYPTLVRRLSKVVSGREDFDQIEFLFHNLSFDSHLEVLNFLFLVASGAVPVSVAPLQLGQLPSPVLEPRSRAEVGHQQHLGLYLDGSFYFFQLSFRLSQPIRVDMMIHDGGWRVIEINGRGHDCNTDAVRDELGVPVEIISESEIIERIVAFLDQEISSEPSAA